MNKLSLFATSLLTLILFTSSSLSAQDQSLRMFDLNHDPQDGRFSNPTIADDKLYFFANNGFSGEELWSYDGNSTPKLLADVRPGTGSSSGRHTIAFQDKFYFAANNDVNGRELFVYDEASGLSLVADIYPGPGWGDPTDLVILNNNLYFRANYAQLTEAIYKYDGINPPELVIPLNGPASLRDIGVFNDKIYYGDKTSNWGVELWSYDGSNAPTIVADLVSVGSFGNPDNFIVFKDKLYFSFGEDSYDSELWVYDGINVPVSVAQLSNGKKGLEPRDLKVYNDKLFFSAVGETTGRELWVYDEINPVDIWADINPGPEDSYPNGFFEFQNALHFNANDGGSQTGELFKTDGENPSELAFDYNPDLEGSAIGNGIVFNNKLYFVGRDKNHGLEPWEYDGMADPKLLLDINKLNEESRPRIFHEWNGDLYFSAKPTESEWGLWKYDGTGRPELIDDRGYISNIDHIGDKLYFLRSSAENYEELWEYDGSSPPIRRNILIGDMPYYFIEYRMTSFQDEIIFIGFDEVNGYEPWVFDGQSDPYLLADINPGYEHSFPGSFIEYMNELYFTGRGLNNEVVLWKYDGDSATPVSAFSLNENVSIKSTFTIFENQLFFIAVDANNIAGIWSFDGANTPTMIHSVPVNFSENSFSNLIVVQDELYMTLKTADQSVELWKYDGGNSPQFETVLIENTSSNLFATTLNLYDEILYYRGEDEISGRELWAYDFSNAPYMVQDVNVGIANSSPQDFIKYQDKLIFQANDQYHSEEFWELNTCAIEEDCCLASFYHFPDVNNKYDLVVVNNSIADAPTFLWEFGDGETSTAAFPQHTYLEPGEYEICLTVTSGDGSCTDKFCDLISFASKDFAGFTINVLPDIASTTNEIIAEEQLNLQIFPNPNNGYFSISLGEDEKGRGQLKIYDAVGNLQKVLKDVKSNTEIDLSNLGSGLYVLIWEGDRRFVGRVVKM